MNFNLSLPGDQGTKWLLSRSDFANIQSMEKGIFYDNRRVNAYALRATMRVYIIPQSRTDTSVVKVILSLYSKAIVAVNSGKGNYEPAKVEGIYIKATALDRKPLAHDDIMVRVSWIYTAEQARKKGVVRTEGGEGLQAGSHYYSHHTQYISAFAIECNMRDMQINDTVLLGNAT